MTHAGTPGAGQPRVTITLDAPVTDASRTAFAARARRPDPGQL